MTSSASIERTARFTFTAIAWGSVAVVAAIALFLGAGALPAVREIGLDFFGTVWSPARGLWGILPMLWGTAAVTAVALAISLPLGVLTALFLTHFCPRRLAALLRAAAELLARRSGAMLAVVVLTKGGFNLLQLLLAARLRQLSSVVLIPVFDVAFALAMLLLARLMRENKQLKDDNDLFV